MSDYYYLDVSLEFQSNPGIITKVYFKNHVVQALRTLFGEVGANPDIDVLKYDENLCRAIIRCPARSYVKLRSSLALCGSYCGIDCAYRIHGASPCLCH